MMTSQTTWKRLCEEQQAEIEWLRAIAGSRSRTGREAMTRRVSDERAAELSRKALCQGYLPNWDAKDLLADRAEDVAEIESIRYANNIRHNA